MPSLTTNSKDRPGDGPDETGASPSITAATVENSRPQPTSSRSTSSNTKAIIPPTKKDMRKIFVGGIGKSVTNDDFYDFFSKLGKVIDSVVMFDRETKKPRGFGFVTFKDPKVALRLLAMGHEGEDVPEGGFTSGKIKMYGRLCEVKASEPKKYAAKNNFSGASNSTASSTLEERVPKKIQFQNGEDETNLEFDTIDGRFTKMSNGQENYPVYHYGYANPVMQEPPRAEYGFGYGGHGHGFGYNQYHANPNFHYAPQLTVPVGYNPSFNGMYYNPTMLHPFPYPYHNPVPPQGPDNFYSPDGYSMGHYPGNSDGGTESEMNAPTTS